MNHLRSITSLHPLLVPWALALITYINHNAPAVRFRESVELMAGHAEITLKSAQRGLASVAYDNSYHPDTGFHNIIKRKGFKRALDLILECVVGASVWFAPVCGSWVFISRSGTDRTQAEAEGNLNYPRVRQSNIMVVHCTILLLAAWMRNLHTFVEQQIPSLMIFSPFVEVVSSCMPWSVVTYLGHPDFGADSLKGIKVWSTSPEVRRLRRHRPKSCREKLSTKTSSGAVNGKTDVLQLSSAYPSGFGAHVAQLFCDLKRRAGADAMFIDDLGQIVADHLFKKPSKRARH